MFTPRYRLIQGEFHIRYPDMPKNGPEPDGDTVTFKPENPQHIRTLRRFGSRSADMNTKGMAKIRFEGIDALETHFKESHQDLTHANAARDLMLTQLGFTNVKFFDDLPNKVESADQDFVPGFILASGIEGNGRVLAFVYAGGATPPCITGKADGDPVFVEEVDLDASINKMIVDQGLAYVEPYTTLPLSLTWHLRAAVKTARSVDAGMWKDETVNTGKKAEVTGMQDAEAQVMWPKLFRRLVSYFSDGFQDLSGFDTWLREDPKDRDDRLLLPAGELANMHDLIQVQGDQIGLHAYEPEDVIILPDEP